MFIKYKSIRKQFLSIGIIIILAISIVFVGVSSWSISYIIQDSIEESSSVYLKSYGNIIGNWFYERQNEMKIYAENPILRLGDREEIYKFLEKERENSKDRYLSLFYSDAQGDYSTNEIKDAGNNADREYYKKAIAGENNISNPIVSRTTGKNIAVVATPVKDYKGNIIGVLGGSIDLKALYSFIEEFNVDIKYDNTYIVSKAGQVITHINPDFIMKGNINTPSEEISTEFAKKAKEIISDRRGSFVLKNNKEKKFIAFGEIPNTNNWKIVTEVPMDVLYKPLTIIMAVLVTVGLIVLVLGILIMNIVAKNQTQPIIELKKVFEEASLGNLHIRANTDSKDELGQAGQSFNNMMEKLADLTFYDGLTGLPNRNTFTFELGIRMKYAEKMGKNLGILVLSLKKFKNINDMFGYGTGDFVLKEVSNRIKNTIEPKCMVSRLSGDEFVILFSEDYYIREIVLKTEEILDEVTKVIIKDNNYIHTLFGGGVAIFPQHGRDPETLIKNASMAQSNAKHLEGSSYKIYHENMEENLAKYMDTSSMVHNALENNEFFLVYQPIINIENNKTVVVEALLRWKSLSGGIVSPGIFIPILEETGLIIPVGEWVLREACKQNKKWQDMGLEPITISVNVSPIQFEQEDFVERIKKVLRETHLKARYLEIEITEGIVMKNVEKKFKRLKRLQDMGIKIAIDDFGTGYSSLSYFNQFPIDTLKIDKSFVDHIEEDKKYWAIVSSMITLGKNLGLSTTVEGVERIGQYEIIKTLGGDRIQGYLYSKPLSSEDFEKYLKREQEAFYLTSQNHFIEDYFI